MDPIVTKFLGDLTDETPHSDDITLSTGVILETLPVSPMLALKVSQRYKDPPVPVVRDEEREVDIPNPFDETYLQLKEEIRMAQGQAVLDVMIARGTRVKYLPPSFPGPDDPSWSDDIEVLLDEPIDPRPLLRYLAWVRYIACVTNEDFQNLTDQMYARLGVTQADVNAALSSTFPGNKVPAADPERQVSP